MNTKAFCEDVGECVIFGEDWHAVKVFHIADHRCVVDVKNLERDVLGIRQSVAVDNTELVFHGTKLVIQWCDGHSVSVLGPVDENIVVSDKVSSGGGPGEVSLEVLHIVSHVGEAEGVSTRVFVHGHVSQRGLNFWAGTGHVHVQVHVGSERDIFGGCPVEFTVCFGLDHHIVVLCCTWRVAALVGAVHKHFISDITSQQVVVRELDGHVFSEALQGVCTVDGLSRVNRAHICSGLALDDCHNVDLVRSSTNS